MAVNKVEVDTTDVTPGLEDLAGYFEQGDLVPVYRTMLADLETPVSVYLKLKALGDVAFLLESVEGGEQVGRYSFLGVNPAGMIQVTGSTVSIRRESGTTTRELEDGEDPLAVVKAELDRYDAVEIDGLPRFIGGAVGYIGYDVVRYFEKLPETATNDLNLPDIIFLMFNDLVIFDHAMHQLIILANAHNTGDTEVAYHDAISRIEVIQKALKAPLVVPESDAEPLGLPMMSNMTKDRYEEMVVQAKEHIAAGDAFQIVLSQRLSRQTSATPFTIYRALRALNPSPYMFFFEFGEGILPEAFSLVGASPEMMVRYEDGIATVRPIAGTRARGATEADDERLKEDLLSDPKERAEHVMLIDLGRNDIGRVCKYGTVKVPDMMVIEMYSHVMHIVSQVQGEVHDELDAFDVFRATFPAGTLSGAPKIRAMEIIEELEGTRRGTYGGAVGYFSYDGSMDTCITIRSMVIQGDKVYVQAGAGIVADSDPTYEYDETLNKARALDMAIRRAEEGL